MTTSSLIDLYDIAEKNRITVDNFNLKRPSLSVYDDGECFIALDEDKLTSSIDEKEKLAHELGHCIQFAFYNKYSPCDIVKRHEYRANRWAVEQLLPLYRLKAAMYLYNEIWELSEFLELSEDFVKISIEIYKRKGLL